LEPQIIRIHRVRERRSWKASRTPSRRFNRLLNVHAELHYVQQCLHRPHALVITTFASGDEKRFSVFHDERALQRAARALARFERIGMARHEREVIAAAVENESEIAHHYFGAESGMQAGRE